MAPADGSSALAALRSPALAAAIAGIAGIVLTKAAISHAERKAALDAANAVIGVVGLGVMGSQLILNLAESVGAPIAGVDLDQSKADETERLAKEEGNLPIQTYTDLATFVSALRRPRVVLLLVPAGKPIDKATEALGRLLSPGDLLVDMGNEWFERTEKREQLFLPLGIHFMGCGISGGERGARRGPCLMPGGPVEGWTLVKPLFEKIAAKVKEEGSDVEEPCVAYIGRGGSGHYVKMVHNGIEYGDMQLIAEAAHLCRSVGLDAGAVSDLFEKFNTGPLNSYLVEITARLYRKADGVSPNPLVDVLYDSAGSKGTGSWTVQQAAQLGVPSSTMAAALEARYLSALKPQRQLMEEMLSRMELSEPDSPSDPPSGWEDGLEDALYASKLCSYAQGMALICAASKHHDWGLDPAKLARIWRGGCIIRARVLTLVFNAYTRNPSLPNLLLDPEVAAQISSRVAGWRRTVALAVTRGLPVPAMSASLAYYDSFRRGRLHSAQCVQAQRDFFGGHGFKRLDAEGTFTVRWE